MFDDYDGSTRSSVTVPAGSPLKMSSYRSRLPRRLTIPRPTDKENKGFSPKTPSSVSADKRRMPGNPGFLSNADVGNGHPSPKPLSSAPSPSNTTITVTAMVHRSADDDEFLSTDGSPVLQQKVASLSSSHLLNGHVTSPVLQKRLGKQTALHDTRTLPTPRSVLLYGKSSPPPPPCPSINGSLFASHRHFVKARMKSTPSDVSNPNCSVSTKTISPEPQPSISSGSGNFSSAARTMETYSRSKDSAVKRGFPLGLSEDVTPVKRKSRPFTWDDDGAYPRESPWLNAYRGGKGKSSLRGGQKSSIHRGNLQRLTPDSGHGSFSSPGCNVTRVGEAKKNHVRRLLEMDFDPSETNAYPVPSNSSDDDDDASNRAKLQMEEELFVECPVCQDMFPSKRVSVHAADCTGKTLDGDLRDPGLVQCPVCQLKFAAEVIAQHASDCGL